MTNVPDPDSKSPPFAKHRIYYIALKWVVIAVAALLAFKLLTGLI